MKLKVKGVTEASCGYRRWRICVFALFIHCCKSLCKEDGKRLEVESIL